MKNLPLPKRSWMFVTSPSLSLITGQHNYTHQKMHALLVEMALEGPVKLLIGGNRYDHYWVNYALAAATPCYEHILHHHIRLSRAETCYQMVELLNQTKVDQVPSLVFELITPFSDQSVPEPEVNQLLFEAILALRRLSQQGRVVVSAHAGQNPSRLLEVLKKAIDRVEQPGVFPPQPVMQQNLIG